MGANLHLIKN